jgi:hypothetical protein
MTVEPLIFIALPPLFDAAETTGDWSMPLAELEALDVAGHLNPLPDWLAVEIIWMAVQFEQEPLNTGRPAENEAFGHYLTALKKLACWQQAVHFDRHFPLLDSAHLNNRGIHSDVKGLSHFLAHPKSRETSPHPLFNSVHYKQLENLGQGVHHPFVHFFRHSSGHRKTSPTPNLFFDCDWYRENYLNNSVIQHPLLHYALHFQRLDIQPSPHFYSHYVRETQQLAADMDPLSHYLKEMAAKGRSFCREGFSPCPYFDRAYYLARYPDIDVAIKDREIDPFAHFAGLGIKEGRHAHAWLRHDMFAPALLAGFTAKDRVAVLVLGMHRSGTSALTRVINLLGMDLPSQLMEANFANETGYWESDELAKQYHDPMLASFNSGWDDVLPIAGHYRQADDWLRYRIALAHYVAREFGQSDYFVLKDPRMCKLVPLWLEVLESLNVEVKIVIPFRNPLEIAESLKARDGVLKEKSLLLWLRHVLEVEYHTRGLSRCLVSYADLLANHRKVIADIAACCQITWLNDTEATEEQIKQFLDPKYYHQRLGDDSLNDESISDWVAQTYQALKHLPESGFDGQACRDKLDTIAKAITCADRLHGKIMAEKQSDLQNLFTLHQQKMAQIKQLAEQNNSTAQIAQQNGLK